MIPTPRVELRPDVCLQDRLLRMAYLSRPVLSQAFSRSQKAAQTADAHAVPP